MKKHATVRAYIAAAPKGVRGALKEVRMTVKKTVPGAEEGIMYGMPGYTWNGKPLFYFAAMKGHLGLYPTPGPIKACASMLGDFSASKGCIRITYSARVPKTLIAKLLKERMKEIRD